MSGNSNVLVAGIIGSILLLLFSAYSAWKYALRKRTPIYVYVLTTFSWFLSFMIIYLIPMDIYTVIRRALILTIGQNLWGSQLTYSRTLVLQLLVRVRSQLVHPSIHPRVPRCWRLHKKGTAHALSSKQHPSHDHLSSHFHNHHHRSRSHRIWSGSSGEVSHLLYMS